MFGACWKRISRTSIIILLLSRWSLVPASSPKSPTTALLKPFSQSLEGCIGFVFGDASIAI